MEFSGVTGVAYRCCLWFVRLAYVNFLWMGFSLVGLIIFGFFPATTAMFTITRHWVMGNEDIPIFRTFWRAYKKEFVKLNILGVGFVAFGYLLYHAVQYLRLWEGLTGQILLLLSFSVILIYLTILLYIFPVAAHYEARISEWIKNAFIIGLTHPLRTVIMVIGSIAVYIILSLVDFVFFFLGSSISLIIMWTAYSPFTRIDENIQQEKG